MYHFRNDYSEGAHPQVLEALVRTNLEATAGYGEDEYCAAAAEMVKARLRCPEAEVHFLVGGTQTNFTAITAFLRPWEAAVAVDTGHIAVHETGAVEARGHKVITAPNRNGKMTVEALRAVWREHTEANPAHLVHPRLLYISDSTELGTIYTKAELTALREVTRELGMYLYLDGARLASALTAQGNDLLPGDLPQLCDAFTIGGTKNGLLFGECLVITNPALMPCFRYCMKQCGGMLAKGRLLGVQFEALLKDDLWLDLGRHANGLAAQVSRGLEARGYALYAKSPTNQVFPILPRDTIARLERDFTFEFTASIDENHDAVRFVTSWATTQQAVDALLVAL